MKRMLMLWRLVRKDLRLLWFAIGHPSRPAWLLPAAGLLFLYAVEPLNFAIPLLGAVDDFVLVPLVLHTLLKLLPAEILASFGRHSLPKLRALS
ncbi:MAG: hypothetical protein JWQ03_2572 [Variovorax sp.]|nr:hypothetical protein [Variovorax sp.]